MLSTISNGFSNLIVCNPFRAIDASLRDIPTFISSCKTRQCRQWRGHLEGRKWYERGVSSLSGKEDWTIPSLEIMIHPVETRVIPVKANNFFLSCSCSLVGLTLQLTHRLLPSWLLLPSLALCPLKPSRPTTTTCCTFLFGWECYVSRDKGGKHRLTLSLIKVARQTTGLSHSSWVLTVDWTLLSLKCPLPLHLPTQTCTKLFL